MSSERAQADVALQARPLAVRRLSLTDENLQLVVVGLSVTVLALCLWVRPDPRGVGTHTRFGLPRCGYLATHGVPGPFCGATTSLCWFVRGELHKGLHVHPMGFVTGFVLVLSIPFSMVSALMGWPWLAHLRKISLPGWTALVCVFLGLFLVGWPRRVTRFLEEQPLVQAVLNGNQLPDQHRPALPEQSSRRMIIRPAAPSSRQAVRLADQ